MTDNGAVLCQLRALPIPDEVSEQAAGKQACAEYPPSFCRNQDIFSRKFSGDLLKYKLDFTGFGTKPLLFTMAAARERHTVAARAGRSGASPPCQKRAEATKSGLNPLACFPPLRVSTQDTARGLPTPIQNASGL